MSVEIITAALSGVVGILGILIGIKNWLLPRKKENVQA
jgi:hypothetical protein